MHSSTLGDFRPQGDKLSHGEPPLKQMVTLTLEIRAEGKRPGKEHRLLHEDHP